MRKLGTAALRTFHMVNGRQSMVRATLTFAHFADLLYRIHNSTPERAITRNIAGLTSKVAVYNITSESRRQDASRRPFQGFGTLRPRPTGVKTAKPATIHGRDKLSGQAPKPPPRLPKGEEKEPAPPPGEAGRGWVKGPITGTSLKTPMLGSERKYYHARTVVWHVSTVWETSLSDV